MPKKEIQKENKPKDNPQGYIELPKVDHGEVEELQKKSGLCWRDKRKLKRKADSSFLINMFFSNGTCRTFVVSTKNEIFDYGGKTYHLRYEDSWFDLSQNQYKLNFFDDYVEPMGREIKIDGDEAFFKVTSSNVKPLIKMEYIKVLAQAQQLSKMLLLLLLFTVINGILTFVGLAMNYYFGRK